MDLKSANIIFFYSLYQCSKKINMELTHHEQFTGKRNRHLIVLKSQIINKKEKEETFPDELIEEENHDAIVRKSKIIERKSKDD